VSSAVNWMDDSLLFEQLRPTLVSLAYKYVYTYTNMGGQKVTAVTSNALKVTSLKYRFTFL